jgi:microcompartment protein CcmK/EutM
MLLAKVMGTVVSTKKEQSMSGLRFMLVQPVDLDAKPVGAQVVAVDAVGSGPGEYVLFATGSSARQTTMTDKRPCDAVIMAIVDNWEVDGEIRYRKGKGG